jgi:adenosylmethionine-8-amino-7-oxononanoate aminotransferase
VPARKRSSATSAKRHAFVSLEDSYHGNTFGAMSVAGSEYREKFPRLGARASSGMVPSSRSHTPTE